jgi:hypothetical protein
MAQGLDNVSIFGKLLAALSFPMNERSILARKVALIEDIVGEVSDMLKPDALVQADALSRDLGVRRVDIVVGKPQCGWRILCGSINIGR